MTIHFTLSEQKEFLRQRGYNIIIREKETETHIHGSRFISSTQQVEVAVNKLVEAPIHIAFEAELKIKLLKTEK